MTTMTTVALTAIDPHPRNVRRNATPDDELVGSVRAQGVLQPLGVVAGAEEGRYLLIAGHRRYGAAQEAQLAEVPVVVLDHLDTEAKQIEAMLVENLSRRDLTATEEAEGYHQLVLAGMDPKQIAEATGRAHSTVVSRLKLAGMVKPAREAVHSGQMTLQQASDLQQLDDRADLRKEVLQNIGSDRFDWALRTAVRQAKQDREDAAKIKAFEDAGLPEIEIKTDQYGRPKWNEKRGPVRVGEDGYYGVFRELEPDAWARESGRPVAVLTKYAPPPKSKAELKREADEKARRAADKETAAARAAASELRIETAVNKANPRSRGDFAFLARVVLIREYASYYNRDKIPALSQAAGVDLPPIKTDADNQAFAAAVEKLSIDDVGRVLTAHLAIAADGVIESARYRGVGAEPLALSWFTHLEQWGHTPSDIDKADRKLIEERAAKDETA